MVCAGTTRGGGLERPAPSSVLPSKESIACGQNSSCAMGFSVQIAFEISFKPQILFTTAFNRKIVNNYRTNSKCL